MAAKKEAERLTRPLRRPWERSRRFTEVGTEPSMTHQSHQASTDVNAIVGRYQRTGQLPPETRQPQYLDVTAFNQDLTSLIDYAGGVRERYEKTLQEAKARKAAAAAAAEAEKNKPEEKPPTPTPKPEV